MHRMAGWSGCPETLFFQHQALLHSCDLSVAVPCGTIVPNEGLIKCLHQYSQRTRQPDAAGSSEIGNPHGHLRVTGFEHSSNCAAVPTVLLLLSRRSEAFGGLMM